MTEKQIELVKEIIQSARLATCDGAELKLPQPYPSSHHPFWRLRKAAWSSELDRLLDPHPTEK
jgi:hypothetical protein